MVKRNPNLIKLQGNYLFREINQKKHALLKKEPHAKLISLGIGDTTEPVPFHICSGLVQGAEKLGSKEGYSGYGPEQGHEALREKIASVFYPGMITHDEIFISDGSKCDIGRLQLLFGPLCTMAVQDPSYPVYVDTGVAIGQTGPCKDGGYEGIAYLPCTPQNNFFPDLERAPRTDLIYFCSPNNPTGATATHDQLKKLVAFAKKNRSILIYDTAYSAYIRDPKLPRSIYEIPGANEVAIELNSFSKMSGFTGVRLAYSVVPNTLLYEDGYPLKQDWQRIMSTFFNGASNIAQQGALAALDPEGLNEIKAQTNFYLQNAAMIKSAFKQKGLTVFGGDNAPYVWVHFPGRKSWDVFHELLEKHHLIATPGSGFGPCGESFMRFSAFGSRDKIEEALARLN